MSYVNKRMMKCNETILRSARVCHLSFMDVARAQRYPHLHHKARFDNKETHTLVDIWDSGIRSKVISFRGSASLQNLCTYGMNHATEFAFCDQRMQVHSGVLKMFKSVHDELMHEIGVDKYILFTGYSLGGAIAMFASLYIAMMFPTKLISCHTFGAPLVGDVNFMTAFTKKVNTPIHVVNALDIVPYLLPRPLTCLSRCCMRYCSVPDEYKMKIPSKDAPHEIISLLRHPLYPHDIKTYIDNLEHHIQYSRIRD